MERYRYRFPIAGELIEVDVIITSPAAWAASPESAEPRWSVHRTRKKIIACSLVIPPAVMRRRPEPRPEPGGE
jgi:hypothetical protein